MKKLAHFAIVLIMAYPITGLIISSCSDEADCSLNGRSNLQCYMYRLNESNNMVRDTLDSLTVTDFYTDSVIINNIKNVDYIELPLRYTVDSTVFVMHYSRTIRDTIIVKHNNVPYFISMDCGYEMQQTILERKYTRHFIDTIALRYNNANNNGQENFRLIH